MDIRLLGSSDAEQYWKLRLEALQQNPEAFAASYEEVVKRQNPIEGVARNLAAEGTYTFGAFNHHNFLVGMVTLMQEKPMKLRHKANIFAMYVSLESRGQGIGKELLTAAINQAKSIDSIEKIHLTVVKSNENAKRLYTKLGFAVFGLEERALKINGEYYDEEYRVLHLTK
ncbi:GNAT family N-acetyltransferase [Pullulanibacillus sp. KACC 23026]|uniref:GNAT family N-acetyltransferase n=1 Tax=Pullulanibacillus sp. KACC 23026 TaxID=3028315 RepID=UPI0023AF1783|nr:GNAT family N-acetyltransferase [Pullulanibacillus sp. KACC 23026]WEG13500.1 GNAT family N-acetyltransferase [Pullulanibacillus sp. KACC 23026]